MPHEHDHAASTLPHGIPDCCAGSPDNVEAGQSVTWKGQQTKDCVGVYGTLVLAPDCELTVDTVMVYEGGFLDVQSGASITFRDTPIDTSTDPEQFGQGLLVFGRLRMSGVENTPFVRLAVEPLAGATTLVLDSAPSGWQAGDRVVLPDTRHLRGHEIGVNYQPQYETAVIASVSGTSVTLTAPLAFDHRGARNADGVLEFLPHVANLTRSIVVRSENPNGTRGHILATGRADVDVRGVRFEGMGRTTMNPLHCTLRTDGAVQRDAFCAAGTGPITQIGTNQIARYPLHLHHLDGPEGLPADVPQWRIEGNVLEDSRKWPITIHNAHFGRAVNNVMFKWEGAGLVTEDGSESGNVIEGNFALVGTGQGGRDGEGREGVGFYFRGPNNIVRGNVAANILPGVGAADAAYGFKYYLFYLGTIGFPTAKGSAERAWVDSHTIPFPEFSDNEVYGATESGLTYWWIGSFHNQPRHVAPSVIHNLRVWHVYNKGIFHYPAGPMLIDGFVQRGAHASESACCSTGFLGQDYFAHGLTLRNVDIQGMLVGINPPTDMYERPFVIEDSVLKNDIDLAVSTLWTSSYRADWIGPRDIIARRVRFGGTQAIVMGYSSTPIRNLVQRDRVFVEDYQGVPGQTFQVFYREQAPSFIVPQTILNSDGSPQLSGSPEAGKTNAETWAVYGVAIAGAVAPCVATRPEIVGFVCDAASLPPPPGPAEPSPECTEGVSVVDAAGAIWTLAPNMATLRDGVHVGGGLGLRYLYTNQTVYALGNDNVSWYRWAGSAWQMVAAKPACSGPAPVPVDCVVSEWSAWSAWADWTLNADGTTESRTRTRTRTVITPSANGGAVCPALSETETETRPFVVTGPRLVIVDGQARLMLPDGTSYRIVLERVN